MNVRGMTLAAVAALALAGCGRGGDSDEEASLAAGSEGGDADCSPGSAAAEASELVTGPLEAGQQTATQLGTEVTFTLDEAWRAPVIGSTSGGLVLQARKPPVPCTRYILFLREFDLYDANAESDDPEALLSANPSVTVLDRQDETVDGSDAVVVDFVYESRERSLLNSTAGSNIMGPGMAGRLWVVDQEDESPLGIPAATTKRDAAWFRRGRGRGRGHGRARRAPGAGPRGGARLRGAGRRAVGGHRDLHDGAVPAGSVLGREGAGGRRRRRRRDGLLRRPGHGRGRVRGVLRADADGRRHPVARQGCPAPRGQGEGSQTEPVGQVEILGKATIGYEDALEAIGPMSLAQGGGNPKQSMIGDPPPASHEYLVDTRAGCSSSRPRQETRRASKRPTSCCAPWPPPSAGQTDRPARCRARQPGTRALCGRPVQA